MKKIAFLILLIISSLVCTSCTSSWRYLLMSAEGIMDESFDEIVEAIKLKDSQKLIDVFADSVKEQEGFDESVTEFINYVKGDIVYFSSAYEYMLTEKKVKENGKTRREGNTSFTIETSTDKYYVAVAQCFVDENDKDNEGVYSVYIIDAKNKKDPYVYRGHGGIFKPGITIDDGTWNR